MSRLWSLLAVAGIVVSQRAPAYAEDVNRDGVATAPTTQPSNPEGVALELWRIDLGAFIPGNLSSTPFGGGGTLSATGMPATFSGTGRDFGIVHPTFFVFDIHPVIWVWSHLFIGGLIGIGWGGQDAPVGPVGSAGGAQGASYFRLAAELGLGERLGPIDLRLSALAGMRTFSTALTTLDLVPCGKGASCYPTASTDNQFFVEPRVSLGLVFGRCANFRMGAYVGADVIPDLAIAAGAYVALNASMAESCLAQARRSRRAPEPTDSPATAETVPVPSPNDPSAPVVIHITVPAVASPEPSTTTVIVYPTLPAAPDPPVLEEDTDHDEDPEEPEWNDVTRKPHP